MLKDTLFRVPRATGLHLMHRRGEGDARELTSWRLRLDAGGVERHVSPSEETDTGDIVSAPRHFFLLDSSSSIGQPLPADALKRDVGALRVIDAKVGAIAVAEIELR